MRTIILFLLAAALVCGDTAVFNTAASAKGAEDWETNYSNLGLGGAGNYLNMPYVRRSKDTSYYYVNTGVWVFDTSSLPDNATITSATIKATPTQHYNQSNNACSVIGEWYTGPWATFSDIFVRDSSTVTANAIAAVPFGNLANGVQYTFNLVNLDNINKTGQTKVRIHALCSFGDVPPANKIDLIQFSGADANNILTVEYSTGTPRLIVVTEQ